MTNPPTNSADYRLRRIGGERIVRVTTLLTLTGSLIYVLALPVFDLVDARRLTATALLVVSSLASLFFLRRGKAALAFQALLLGAWLAITATAVVVSGIRTAMVFAYPVVVMVSWPLGRRAVLTAGLASILAVIGLGLAEHLGLLPPLLMPPWILLSLVYSMILAVAMFFTGATVAEQDRWLDSEAGLRRELDTRMRMLSGQAQELRLVADNVPVLLCAYEGMSCRFANQRYAEFFGFTAENVVGRHLREVLGEESYALTRPLVERVLAGEQVAYRGRRASPGFGERLMEIKLVPDAPQPGRERGFYGVFLDITEQEAAAQVQRRQSALQEALLSAQSEAGLGMFIIEAGKVVHANDALCRLFGYSQAEIKALPSYLELAHPSDRARILRNHERRLRGEQFENHYPISVVTKSGERREAELTAAYMAGETPRVMCILVDATEQIEARAEIERLNAELERRVAERTAELTAANRELESFAYSISHDLRAPLRGIDGFSKLLADEYRERLDAQGVDYLERVRRAAQRMGHLIDDILELSRVTRQEMRRVRVDLSQIAAELIEELARAAPAHRVETHLAPGLTALGDPQLLRVLMQNLVENAWKYSSKTPAPRIEFGQERHGEETVFFVRDNGVGFDMQFAGRLFTPFQRLHRPEEFEGTGIGLATVARIAHRHGGRAWIESEPGKGTTVRFTLCNPGVP